MSNFLSCNTWIWSDQTPTKVKVSKLATSYYIKLEIGHSSIDLALSKTDLQEIRDKINLLLLEEFENNG